MIRLDRSKVTVPADWEKRVAGKFFDYEAYQKKAVEFEKLPIHSGDREKGFRKYAPEVLPNADFPPLWGEAKDELAKMSHNKCSYCESVVARRAAGHVDHFQPKSLFPSLAYDWYNYFLTCTCNILKGRKWPRKGGYVRPDQGDPAKEFSFAEDGTMKAVKKGSDAWRTVKDFRLNESWLVLGRKTTIKCALEDIESVIDALCSTDKEIVRAKASSLVERYSDPARTYSAAVSQCLRRAWAAACPDAPL